MISVLWRWIGGAFTLLMALVLGRAYLAKDERKKAEEAFARQADTDTLKTRERIDDATRDVPEPDAARDRLQRFGAGTRPPER